MKKIGVFFGSRSPEHDVSIITGQLIISGLRGLKKYRVIPVYITKTGEWLIDESLGSIETFRKGKIDMAYAGNYSLDLDSSKGRLVFRKKGLLGRKIVIDLVFPAFHGQNGEDGTFQGIMEMLDVPYVGSGVFSSALAMDKVATKHLYRSLGIPTTPFVELTGRSWIKDRKNIDKNISGLKKPLIVKPARLGSSIGLARVQNAKELEFAVEVALHYDSKVIVEECISDLMDVTCCVIGNDEPVTSLLQESVFESGFFSYEDKYLKGGGAQTGKNKKNIFIPARRGNKTTADIRETSLRIYKLFGCSGIARIDFLYDKRARRWYANEINTLPGTLYHHLWNKSGITFGQLLEKLIGFAEEKYRNKKNLSLTFESSILEKTSSSKLSLKGI